MGLADYLGWDFRSAADLADREHPAAPSSRQLHGDADLAAVPGGGLAPMIRSTEALRPQWLFGKTVHEGCDRAGYYEQGDFAEDYNSAKCQ
jgi:hydrogenase small subunit